VRRLRSVDLLLAVTLVGAVLRVAWWAIAQPGPVSDYLGYRSLAFRLWDTGEYTRLGNPTAWRTPGYPVFLALGMIPSRSDRWLSLLNVGLSIAAIPLVWLLARRLGLSRRTALCSAAVACVSPTLLLWAPVLGSENLQVIALLGAWCLALAPQPTPRTVVMCGVLFGCAVLVRPESGFYLLALPLLLWSTGTSARDLARRSGVIVLVAAAVVAPWYVRNEIVVGDGAGLSTTGGVNFHLAHRDEGYGWYDTDAVGPLAGLGELAANREGYELGLDHVRAQPSDLVRAVRRGTEELWRPPRYAAYYSTVETAPDPPYPRSVSRGVIDAARQYAEWGWFVVGALAAAGAVVLLLRHRRVFVALAGLVVANWLCFAVVFWALPRYRFAIEPVIAIAAGAALGALRFDRRPVTGQGRGGSG
jgi:hypothetical protein